MSDCRFVTICVERRRGVNAKSAVQSVLRAFFGFRGYAHSDVRARGRCLWLVVNGERAGCHNLLSRPRAYKKPPECGRDPPNISRAMDLSFFLLFPRLLSSCCTSQQSSARTDRLVMLTVCSQQILDHMDESGVYNESDLAPFHRRLGDLR